MLVLMQRLPLPGATSNRSLWWDRYPRKLYDGAVDMWAIEAHLKNKNAGVDAGITGVDPARNLLSCIQSRTLHLTAGPLPHQQMPANLNWTPRSLHPGFCGVWVRCACVAKSLFAHSSQVGLEVTP